MNLLIGVVIVIVAYFWFAAPDPAAAQKSKPDAGDTPAAAAGAAQTANAATSSAAAAKKRKGKKKSKTAGAGAATTAANTSKAAAEDAGKNAKKEAVVKPSPSKADVANSDDSDRLSSAAAATANAPTPPSPAEKSSGSRSSTPSFLPDMDADDSEGSVSRVLRVRGPEEYATSDHGSAEDGWQMVEVAGAKKPSKSRSITIVGSSSSSYSAAPPPSQADPATLTKKQRENLKKSERVKAAKAAHDKEQEQRLRTYRKEQEKAWVAKETERDKLAARERAMNKNNAAAVRSAPDPAGGFAGKGIWD
ncbi:hypothetical protein BDZ88DRAFT_451830 [Geranomyces variabilis]|nr:hypothetical protein BDZ88DRAFT_451830 [Geranomyces variabilis]KAJ3135241.1 hypothetical protein HDU90_003964 [Geranomyces variabilis]